MYSLSKQMRWHNNDQFSVDYTKLKGPKCQNSAGASCLIDAPSLCFGWTWSPQCCLIVTQSIVVTMKQFGYDTSWNCFFICSLLVNSEDEADIIKSKNE